MYDADLAVVTYLFRKGDDRDPDKERLINPGVLGLLGNIPYEVKPILLPVEAYYPAVQPFVRTQILNVAEAEVAQTASELQKVTNELQSVLKVAASVLDLGTADAARIKVSLAEQVTAAKARLESVKARLAADAAKNESQPYADAEAVAIVAGKADLQAIFAQSNVDVAKAELKRTAALIALKPNDEKRKQELADAEKALAQATEKREVADKARLESSAKYTPLGTLYPTESTGRRTALARWMTHRNNPLTARVAANQIWMRHFGQALLPTVLDFGQNGQVPTHPALLDWLAVELIEPSSAAAAPWSMKQLHRQIVTSRTYRMASTPDENNLAVDPDNRWLWRMPSRRMEAELVRDGILFVAGKLDLTRGGPDIDYSLGLSVNRRSLYFRHAQEKQMDFLKIFDCAAVTECYQRKESIVPQQALALANSELTLVQARITARRLHETTATESTFITAAFERVLSRPPTVEETSVAQLFLTQQHDTLIATGERLIQSGGAVADTGQACFRSDSASTRKPCACVTEPQRLRDHSLKCRRIMTPHVI